MDELQLCKNGYNFDESSGNGPPMSLCLKHATYINDRLPRLATMVDSSRLKIVKHSFPNRLLCLIRVKFKRTDGIDKNNLRINLKKTYIINLDPV